MKNIVTSMDSKSPLSESIKTLRTNLQFMKPSKGLQTILVTSTLPTEGKSWVSSNLAVAFAQTGQRTVLIDGDMRKGTVHFLFDSNLTPGLSNFLSGVNLGKDENKYNNYNQEDEKTEIEKIREDIKAVIQETEVENLYVITAGELPPNPSELIMSDRMNALLKGLEEFADVVIFDGTPSALVTDAIILSRMVNSTVIVAEYNKTKMNTLKQVKEDIEKVGGKIAGVVLNKIPEKESAYGYGYSYRYNYGYNSLEEVKPKKGIFGFLDNYTNDEFNTSRNVPRNYKRDKKRRRK
ncbi:MAG: CpsD/CapB family tyrosine-protein kinase [Clostridia bacterium]|nr:CpsD/CapB family tyrosine-protein kinase [Clostridia bacterium]